MPKNCSADVQRVISYIDTKFTFGSKSEKDAIKAKFGVEGVEHLDDVAGARTLLGLLHPLDEC